MFELIHYGEHLCWNWTGGSQKCVPDGIKVKDREYVVSLDLNLLVYVGIHEPSSNQNMLCFYGL